MALHLKEWLPNVLVGQVDCFVSSTDISAGNVWLEELFRQLDQSQAGIVCVTRESMTRGWMLFEAGALAKRIDTPTQRVCPLLLDLDPGELQYPLAAFQWKQVKPDAESTSKDSMFALLKMVNDSIGASKLEEPRLKAQFDAFWPKFWDYFKEQRNDRNGVSPAPTQVGTNEILVELRSGFQQMANLLGRSQQIEIPVRCPVCNLDTLLDFFNAPGATRHFSCTRCGSRLTAHLSANREAWAKVLEPGTNPFSGGGATQNFLPVTAQAMCPGCGLAQPVEFAAVPGATRHVNCDQCGRRFMAHRNTYGVVRSRPLSGESEYPPAPGSLPCRRFEHILRKTQFWVHPSRLGELIDAAIQADADLTDAEVLRTPTELKTEILRKRSHLASKEVNTFIKILLHGKGFAVAPGVEGSPFYSPYSNKLNRDSLLRSFYEGQIRRLSGFHAGGTIGVEIGQEACSELKAIFQTESIAGAEDALVAAMKTVIPNRRPESDDPGRE
jgi:hypothetical protein